MLTGLEVGDHFTMNLYNKVIPPLILKYWRFFFFKNFFVADVFSVCLHVLAKKKKKKKKIESDF